MAQVPNRLQPDTLLPDNLALINDNFDKTVSDISDLGAKFSKVGNFTTFALGAGASNLFTVYITDSSTHYVPGFMQIVPRVDVRVDANDADHDLLDGASLTAAQKRAIVSISCKRTAASGFAAEFGGFLTNLDTGAHDYYFSVDESYMYTPTTNTFR